MGYTMKSFLAKTDGMGAFVISVTDTATSSKSSLPS